MPVWFVASDGRHRYCTRIAVFTVPACTASLSLLRGSGGCNAPTTNVDTPGRDLQNIRDKHV